MRLVFGRIAARRLAGACVLAALALLPPLRDATAQSLPFASLPGRWVGEGRLGFKEGKVETVKCIATYFIAEDGQSLKQNIRCATADAKIEVKSEVAHASGVLTGKWSELIYNMEGELTGQITPRGYQVGVKGPDLAATMEILVKDNRQIVEIHFDSRTLIGLMLVLQKG